METNNETVVPEHYNPNQLVTYKVIEDGITSYPTGKVVDIEWCLEQMRHNTKVSAELRLQISQLENNLSEYLDMDAEEIVSSICEIFGFNPTKEVEFEATARISGTVQIPLSELKDFDIDNIDLFVNVDSYNYDINADAEIEDLTQLN